MEPLVEPSALPSGIKVASMELCGDSLYIGSNEGSIIKYNFTEDKFQSASSIQRTKTRDLGPKAPVTFLRSASALERLLAVCDSTLMVLNASDLTSLPLSGSHKMRGIHACCINENPCIDDPFAVQMCLGKKKQLAVINITEEQMSVDKIRELQEPVKLVSMDGVFVCAALEKYYVIINVASGSTQDLFPCEDGTHPIIARVSREEFLLNAPGDLGMCITTEGISSDKPPFQWLKPVSKIVFCHPYIITLTTNNDAIMIYSILDQKHKQTLTFNGSSAIGNYDGKLLVASTGSVYALSPVSVQIQIEYLLENERIDEALELAENASYNQQSSEGLEEVLNKARVKAAFISLKSMELRKAQELFIRGRVDPREVISLFPRLLPTSSNFTRSVPPLHDIADIHQISKMDGDKVEQLTNFLMDFLECIRASQGDNLQNKKEVNTALVKLYSKGHPQKLINLVDKKGLSDCDFQECINTFQANGCHHALALFYLRNEKHDEAFSIWTQLTKKALDDPQFPGLQSVVSHLCHSPLEVIWRHADFILQQSQDLGVKVFMMNEELNGNEQKVVDFLQKYSKARMEYLKYLIQDKKSELETFHTELAIMYLERIPDDSEFQEKFRQLILQSSVINFKYLLSRVEASPMSKELLHEKAILYGKMKEHEKALRILVHHLNDFASAEEYCNQLSSTSEKDSSAKRQKEKLLLLLLTIYLDENSTNPNKSDDQANKLKMAAINLINRRAEEFKASEIIHKLPNDWALSTINPALMKMTKASQQKKRMKHLERSLSKSVNLGTKMELLNLQKEVVVLTESSYCVVCKKSFANCQFARYPNGVVVHIECMRDPKICPLTGQIFTIEKN